MKKKLSVLIASALMLSIMGSLTSCASESNNTIKIGGIAPLTGEVSTYGKSAKQGADLAFEEINANGGILGKKIKLDVLDDKGETTDAVNAYKRHQSNQVSAIWGAVTSKPTVAVAQEAAKDGILLMTPSASQAQVTSFGDNAFRTCFLDPAQGAAMAKFAVEKLNVKSAAILYNTSDDYSQGLAKSFEETAKELGVNIIAKEGYAASDQNYKTQLTKISGTNPQILFVPDYYSTDALIAGQAREIGLNIPILGGDGWDGTVAAVAESNRSVLNEVYFSNHYSVEDTDPRVKDFVDAYKEKYNTEPNAFAALGYDSAYMIAQAINEANTDNDHKKIVEAMKNIKFKGVTGEIFFPTNGDPNKSVTITKIEDGNYKYYDRITPQ